MHLQTSAQEWRHVGGIEDLQLDVLHILPGWGRSVELLDLGEQFDARVLVAPDHGAAGPSSSPVSQ